uniref:Na(+)/H(+) exchange regulatory cofactor NHE-RF1 n=1 Tax=Latimeria chalumnae TaxID=7897 RepID=H3B474_LATCH
NADSLRPRVCALEKGPKGYGFHLHGEKGKTGQFIRLVEEGSAAENSGLRAGDRLVEVNEENVENDNHQQVVSRIRSLESGVKLLVVDRETDELLRSRGLQCRAEFVNGLPGGEVPQEEEPKAEIKEGKNNKKTTMLPQSHGDNLSVEELSVSGIESIQKEHRPRLCQMKKGANGYGFNLHSEKSKPGQYIRAVDPDSPAESAGLLPQDRIIEVNGICVEGKLHSDVVANIKTGGDETKLLVVDPETDDFFRRCQVIPSEAHLSGPLPEPVVNGEVEEKMNGKVTKESGPTNPTPEETSIPTTPTALTREVKKKIPESKLLGLFVPPPPMGTQDKLLLLIPKTQEEEKDDASDPGLNLNISLAAAKERAHQKRKAPQMDWSKKNEVFSNL